MNVGTGEVHTHLRKGHTGEDVLAFFKQIDATVPRGLAVHVILDNPSAHKAPEVKKWLAHKDRRRWHLHFIPTSSSWLNLVERWFKELTDKRLRRGVFTSVADLTEAITVWAGHWNSDPKPFVWKATAQEIIKKVSRGRATSHQIKSAADQLVFTSVVVQFAARVGRPVAAQDVLERHIAVVRHTPAHRRPRRRTLKVD
jgi:transposase